MISKFQLQDEIYQLELRIKALESALIHAGVFSFDNREVYNTRYGRVLVNEVKSK